MGYMVEKRVRLRKAGENINVEPEVQAPTTTTFFPA